MVKKMLKITGVGEDDSGSCPRDTHPVLICSWEQHTPSGRAGQYEPPAAAVRCPGGGLHTLQKGSLVEKVKLKAQASPEE